MHAGSGVTTREKGIEKQGTGKQADSERMGGRGRASSIKFVHLGEVVDPSDQGTEKDREGYGTWELLSYILFLPRAWFCLRKPSDELP